MVAKSLDGLSTGLWNGAVMATYIYLIEDNSNKVSVQDRNVSEPLLGEDGNPKLSNAPLNTHGMMT